MPAPKRPNVIWIFGDQHRAQSTGYAGDPDLHTPELDRLAEEGVVCDHAVSGFPLCCPARGSLLTGLYPHRCVPGHEHPLPAGQRTIAHELKDAGYHTAYFGKWHLAGFKEADGRAAYHITDPAQRGGFDEWVGYDNNNSQFDCWVHGGEGDSAFHYRLPGFETDALTDLLVSYLERQAQPAGDDQAGARPFFAALSVQPPHDPYIAPAEWMQRHSPAQVTLRPNVPAIPHVVDRARRQLAGYNAMIENLDWNIGRIRAALERLGLMEDTHLIFFSDHGDMQGSHGQFGKNSPWEESIRVPFIIAGGGEPFYRYRRGRNRLPINIADIPATTLGLCGIPVPDWMQGEDFSGLRLPERPAPRRSSAYLQSVVPTCHRYSTDRPWRGVVTEDGWKYTCLEGQPWMLYNLNEDPYEQANLAHNAKYWPERKRLQAELAAWIERTGDAFALPALPPA